MAQDLDKKELWVDWTNVAMAAFEMSELPDTEDDADEVADSLVEVATKFADSMLDEYEARFSKGGESRRRKRGKRHDEDEG